jgi:hypothetical protein
LLGLDFRRKDVCTLISRPGCSMMELFQPQDIAFFPGQPTVTGGLFWTKIVLLEPGTARAQSDTGRLPSAVQRLEPGAMLVQ